MEVYWNNNFWSHPKGESPLKPVYINQAFVWDGITGVIPAVYLGENGMVLDCCIRISPDSMKNFLKKWEEIWMQKGNEKGLMEEECEQVSRENPCRLDFCVDVQLDGLWLERSQSCSVPWYPAEILEIQSALEEGHKQDRESVKLMEAYGCDSEAVWVFERSSYLWPEQAGRNCKTDFKKVKLRFKQMPVTCTARRFVTEPGKDRETMEVVHPVTKEKYTVTLLGCENVVLSQTMMASISSRMGGEYPGHYQILSYTVTPEIKDGFRIEDCAGNDQPRKREKRRAKESVSVIGGAHGPVAFFAAGKSSDPAIDMAMSSLHFEPTPRIEWKCIFETKFREDMELEWLPLDGCEPQTEI